MTCTRIWSCRIEGGLIRRAVFYIRGASLRLEVVEEEAEVLFTVADGPRIRASQEPSQPVPSEWGDGLLLYFTGRKAEFTEYKYLSQVHKTRKGWSWKRTRGPAYPCQGIWTWLSTRCLRALLPTQEYFLVSSSIFHKKSLAFPSVAFLTMLTR